MTPDPARQLADTGWRVLQTMRPLVSLPGSYRLPDAYESLLLDPMAALSGICDGLLERPHRVPVATGRGVFQNEPWRRLLSDIVRQGGSPAATRPDPPGLDGQPSFEQVRRATKAPLVQVRDERGTDPGLPMAPVTTHPSASISPAQDPRPADRPRQPAEPDPPEPPDRLDRYAEARQTARHEPPRQDASYTRERSPAGAYPTDPGRSDDEPSPQDGGETRRFARRELSGEGKSFPGGERPAGIERLAAAGPIARMTRDDSASDVPDVGGAPTAGETRLATSASRLAAMLRADAAVVDTEEDMAEVTQDGAVSSIRSNDEHASDPSSGEDWSGLNGPVGLEEIMERLADELETGFVRTYGSSGG